LKDEIKKKIKTSKKNKEPKNQRTFGATLNGIGL